MTDSSITEADRFMSLCADVVHSGDETWLTEFNSDVIDGGRMIHLVGSEPGRSASIEWSEVSGFKVEIHRPDSHYYEVVRTAAEAFSRVLLLACD